MKVLNFIIENWDNIAVILLAAVSVLAGIIKKDKNLIMEILFKLVSDAEAMYGENTGDLKRADVLSSVYDLLPLSLKTFVHKNVLILWIEEALAKAKVIWKDNPAIAEALGIFENALVPKEEEPVEEELAEEEGCGRESVLTGVVLELEEMEKGMDIDE